MNKEYSIVSSYWSIAEFSPRYSRAQTSLARYSDDLYKLLVRRLSAFEMLSQPTPADIQSIRSIFEEFLRVTEKLKGIQ
jgi:hypothetical protein